MRLSTRTEYGIQAMLDLAEHDGLGPVQSHDIAERKDIPEPYLNQLLTLLRKGGMITSRRGPGGGHTLARPAAEITLDELVLALEGNIWSVEDLSGEPGRRVRSTGLRDVWKEVDEAARAVLARVTLAEIVEREHEQVYTYHI